MQLIRSIHFPITRTKKTSEWVNNPQKCLFPAQTPGTFERRSKRWYFDYLLPLTGNFLVSRLSMTPLVNDANPSSLATFASRWRNLWPGSKLIAITTSAVSGGVLLLKRGVSSTRPLPRYAIESKSPLMPTLKSTRSTFQPRHLIGGFRLLCLFAKD